jgi:glycerophosphoryl diester phosphodiesterase
MTTIIAHRGLRHEQPENTRDAIVAALRCPGIYGVEFDVELTRDKQPVVLHQETVVPDEPLSRVGPASRDFTSRDWVIEVDAATVSKMDAGSWMGDHFAHLKVPSLKEVLNLPWAGRTAYIELKDATFWGRRDLSRPSEVIAAAHPVLRSFTGPMNVISFNPEILSLMRKRMPEVPTTLALWTEWRSKISEAIAEAKGCGASTISIPDILVLENPAWVREAHERDVALHVYPVSPARGEPEFLSWTPESQAEKWRELHRLGVDAIISDFGRETVATLNSGSHS